MSVIHRFSKTQLLALTGVLVLVALALANFIDVTGNDESDDADVGGFVILSAFAIAVAALLLFVVAPRAERRADGNRPATLALVLGLLALLTVSAFWSGLPFALGVPAVFLGTVGAERANAGHGRRSQAVAGVALGAVAVVAGGVFCVIG